MARRATLIKQIRSEHDHLLLLDAGNSLVGAESPALADNGKASVEVMDRLGYDAAGLGPNDLSLGLSELRARVGEAAFPFLSANAVAAGDGSLAATHFVIREMAGFRVAVAGLTGELAGDGITVRDPLTSAQSLVAELEQQSDLLILLSQAGPEVDQKIADEVAGIDLIIGGGPALTEPVAGKAGALILRADQSTPYHAGRAVGIGEFVFNPDGALASYSWQRRWLGPDIADDPEMAAWVAGQPAAR